jgi:hypothetical protein
MAERYPFREIVVKKDLGYLLAFLLLFVLMFQGFILADRTFFVRDVTRLEIPTRLLCTQLLKEGNFALWTDGFGNGQPFLANPKNAVFYPTSWLFLILPFFLAFKLHYVIHFIAAYLGLYYLGKSYGLSRMAGFLAASLFLTGGPYLSSVEFYNHIAALAWLPWILLCQRISYRKTPWRTIIPSIFWALAILAGSPEIVVIAILLLLLQTLFFLENGWKEIARVFLPLMLAVFASSVQLLPTLEHWKTSERRLVQTQEWPLEAVQLLNLSFPDILGNDREPGHKDFWAGEFFDRGNPLHYSLYIGFAPLLLIFFCFQKPAKKLARFLTFSILLFLLLSLGHYSMLYPVILKIPLLAAIFYPVKFIIGSIFALSLLAALGFDHLFHSERKQKKRILSAFALSAFAFVVFLIFRKEIFHLFRQMFVITEESSARELQRSFWHGMGFLMVYAGALLLALPKRLRRATPALMLAIIVIDLAYHNRHINPVIPTAFFREPMILNPSREPARIHREEFIRDDLRPAFQTAEGAARYYRISLYPFCGIGEDIRYLFNKDSYIFYGSRYHALLRSMSDKKGTELIKILRAQGCEYFIGHAPLPDLPSQVMDVQGYPLCIQEINDPVPPAYIVHRSAEAHSPEEALSILEEETFDIRKNAILKNPAPFPDAGGPMETGNEAVTTIKDFSSEKKYSISMSSPGFLIIPGNSAPGWKAWVDGIPTAVLDAYPASRAVCVPTGEHRIILEYRPQSFTAGSALTLIFLVSFIIYPALSAYRARANAKQKKGRPPSAGARRTSPRADED